MGFINQHKISITGGAASCIHPHAFPPNSANFWRRQLTGLQVSRSSAGLRRDRHVGWPRVDFAGFAARPSVTRGWKIPRTWWKFVLKPWELHQWREFPRHVAMISGKITSTKQRLFLFWENTQLASHWHGPQTNCRKIEKWHKFSHVTWSFGLGEDRGKKKRDTWFPRVSSQWRIHRDNQQDFFQQIQVLLTLKSQTRIDVLHPAGSGESGRFVCLFSLGLVPRLGVEPPQTSKHPQKKNEIMAIQH